ncbi:MAG TPA: PAS domain S-box protein, partial [Rhodopila sp.]|nr:PAS domain S-box protein [Rhodopila sp.]
RETEASFAALADSMPQLIWTAQPDGRNDYFNARYREFTGWSADALLNERWQNLLHPDDAPVLAERWQHAVRTGEPFEAESRLRRHDGVYRWMLVRALPVHHSEAGTIRRWFGSCTDITDLVEAVKSPPAAQPNWKRWWRSGRRLCRRPNAASPTRSA